MQAGSGPEDNRQLFFARAPPMATEAEVWGIFSRWGLTGKGAWGWSGRLRFVQEGCDVLQWHGTACMAGMQVGRQLIGRKDTEVTLWPGGAGRLLNACRCGMQTWGCARFGCVALLAPWMLACCTFKCCGAAGLTFANPAGLLTLPHSCLPSAPEHHLLLNTICLLTPLLLRFGTVEEVNLFRERRTNQSKGCGFVTMATRAQAVAAMDGLDEKHLVVRRGRVWIQGFESCCDVGRGWTGTQ